MAVNATERRGYDERIRQTREESEEKEADLVARQRAEMKRLEKRHQDEIRKITESYQNQLEEAQGRNRETLSERDVKHRKDVDDMKDMYLSQLRKKMEENAVQRRELETSYKNQLDKQKQVSDVKFNHSSNLHEAEMDKRDQELADAIQKAREGMREGIEHNRDGLNDAHEKERRLLVQGRDEALMAKDKEKKEIQKGLRNELAAQKRRNRDNDEMWREKYASTVRDLNENYGENIESHRQLLREAVDDIHGRYQDKLDQKRDELERGSEQFKEDVADRQNTQIRSRDNKIQDLKSKLNLQKVDDARRRGIENRNLTRAYEARYGDLEKQKTEASEAWRELADHRVDTMREKNLDLNRRSERIHRSETAIANARNREDRRAVTELHKDQMETLKNSTDKRIVSIQKTAQQNNKDMADYFDASLDTMKERYAEKVDEQRESHIDEQGKTASVFTGKYREMESKYQKRLEQLAGKYEDKITQLKENQKKEKKMLVDGYESKLAEGRRSQKFEKEAVEQKYESKLALIDEKHQDEVDRINKKHEEDMKNVALRMQNYSRKA